MQKNQFHLCFCTSLQLHRSAPSHIYFNVSSSAAGLFTLLLLIVIQLEVFWKERMIMRKILWLALTGCVRVVKTTWATSSFNSLVYDWFEGEPPLRDSKYNDLSFIIIIGFLLCHFIFSRPKPLTNMHDWFLKAFCLSVILYSSEENPMSNSLFSNLGKSARPSSSSHVCHCEDYTQSCSN